MRIRLLLTALLLSASIQAQDVHVRVSPDVKTGIEGTTELPLIQMAVDHHPFAGISPECPENFVPAGNIREAGMRGAWNGTRGEAFTGGDRRSASADRSSSGQREDDTGSLSRKRHHRADVLSLAKRVRGSARSAVSKGKG